MSPLLRCLLAGVILTAVAPSSPSAQEVSNALAPLESEMALAENSLREGELQIAESHYRNAVKAGWMLTGALESAAGRLDAARTAFERASTATVQPREALHALALLLMQMRQPDEAVHILSRLVAVDSSDMMSRRLLAQAYSVAGQTGQAVQALAEAHGVKPDDLEVTFSLASGYLKVKKVDAAERLFAEIIKARPIPETHVLIGRTYRDSGYYDRARASLRAALDMNPRTRRAHYYLGTTAVMQEGVVRLEEAITEFQKELKLAPDDPVTNFRLGMALVEARRPADACSALEITTRSANPPPDAFYYLGRCRLELDRVDEAVAFFRRALELSRTPAANEDDVIKLRNIHYQLALALRKLGSTEEAARHFEEAERASARRADVTREELTRYLTDAPDPDPVEGSPLGTLNPLAGVPAEQRAELKRQTTSGLARAYFNLGVMQVQSRRVARAPEYLEEAAALDPAFPNVQYTLGVAYFNAQQYDKATLPLQRALEADQNNAEARRMLALAWLNTEAYDKAAELLRNDPEREENPSLQYAFGLALLRGKRIRDAQIVFSQLVAEHGETAELNVVMGHIHAQQGDFDAATKSLLKALELKRDVPEANGALGVIYLKQGRLAEAEAALRAEIAISPHDLASRQHLATVLDLEGERDEAIALLRVLLRTKPDHADARYLLGKVLLAQGAAPEAVEHLEAAARLAPEDANIHYQLGQAYQKLGRADLAEREFDVFRQLKDKRAGRTP